MVAVVYDFRQLVTNGALLTNSFADFLELFKTPWNTVETSKHRRENGDATN
jgi:hypothetical protein